MHTRESAKICKWFWILAHTYTTSIYPRMKIIWNKVNKFMDLNISTFLSTNLQRSNEKPGVQQISAEKQNLLMANFLI